MAAIVYGVGGAPIRLESLENNPEDIQRAQKALDEGFAKALVIETPAMEITYSVAPEVKEYLNRWIL